jgi:type II secretory pathway pseudopilin PulG
VFWDAFATYLDDIGNYTQEQSAAALAAALGGNLPPLTGKALQFLRVNAGATAAEFAVALTQVLDDAAPKLGGKLNTNGHIIRDSKGTSQAVASTVTPPTDGKIFHLTAGTGPITGFTNGDIGLTYTIIPDVVVSMTNSSNLAIEGGADYTTVVGTAIEIIQDTATVWRVRIPPVSKIPKPDYNPPDFSFTYLSKTTKAHGLSSIPTRIEIQLVCVTADAPYAVGDVMPISGPGNQVGASMYGIITAADATNIILRLGTAIGAITDTGGPINLTAANWKIRLMVWM